MNLDEALTYSGSAIHPQTSVTSQVGSTARSRKQAVRRKLYQIFYHGQAGRATLGFSFHRSPSAGKREEIRKLEQYSLKQKYHIMFDGVLRGHSLGISIATCARP